MPASIPAGRAPWRYPGACASGWATACATSWIAPPAEAVARMQALIARAFTLIDAGNPELAAEIRTIVQEIVLATGPGGVDAVQFDGVSAFLLWGGVVLNATSYATPIETVQALAHESGHNLLFGLCADGPLQNNDDDERYASPLRV